MGLWKLAIKSICKSFGALTAWLLPTKSRVAVLKLSFRKVCYVIIPQMNNCRSENTQTMTIYTQAHTHACSNTARAHNKPKIMDLSWEYASNTHACGCRNKAKKYLNARRLACRGIFGLFSSCSSSAFRQIFAAVREQIYDNLVLTLPCIHCQHKLFMLS